jgi:hypothetical protein
MVTILVTMVPIPAFSRHDLRSNRGDGMRGQLVCGPCGSTTCEKESLMLTTRKLGKEGLEVSEIGLGCMGMSYAYGTPDDEESTATIHRAIAFAIK